MGCSIIIPTFNRVDLIGYTIESLIHCNYQDIEIIVIDDSSTDNTVEYLKQNYPSVFVTLNDKKGASSARNKGLALAKKDFIMYLDSDDLVGKDFFNNKIDFLINNPDVSACYGDYDYFSSNGVFAKENIIFKHKYPKVDSLHSSEYHLKNYLSGNYMPQNSIIFRKSFLQKIGGHDELLPINQDVELVIRALLEGMQIIYLNDGSYVYIRNHNLDERVGTASNSMKKYESMLVLRKEIWSKIKIAKKDTKELAAALSKFLFDKWKELRHSNEDLANEYLSFAKSIFWPIQLEGNAIYVMLSKLIGPVAVTNLKFAILKRD